MSKFIYICGINEKSIYYNDEKKEFYAVDEDFFPFESEKNFDVHSNYFTQEQIEELSSNRVTDEQEINFYKSMYDMIKTCEKKENSKIYKMCEKLKKEVFIPEVRHDLFKYFASSFIFTAVAILTYINFASLRIKIINRWEDEVDKYYSEHQNDEAHLASLYAAIENNTTISNDLKRALRADFEALAESNIYISDSFSINGSTVKSICSRLENTDFTKYDETNYVDLLAYILFCNNDIVANSLATNLDEYANNRPASEQSILFGSLYSKDKTRLLNKIFSNGTDVYIEEMAKELGADKNNIRKILKLIDNYKNAQTEQEKNSSKEAFYNQLASIFNTYYHDSKNISEIDKFILASQVYNGKFEYNNNFFSDTLIFTYDDPNYGIYNLYFDTQTGVDISQAVYLKKLVELIDNKGNNLDYDDPDSRFLIYLTILAYEDKMYYYAYEITDCITSEDLANKIFEAVFSKDEGFNNLNPQILYTYFSSGTINLDYIVKALHSPNDDAFSLALFVEYFKCLKREINAGNLSKEEYQKYLEDMLKWVEKDGEEVYAILVDSLENDSSLFSELCLSPFTFTYVNEDIKKYIYVPKE